MALMANQGQGEGAREVRSKRSNEAVEDRNVRARIEVPLALPWPSSEEADNIPLQQGLRVPGAPVGPRTRLAGRGARTADPPTVAGGGIAAVPVTIVPPPPEKGKAVEAASLRPEDDDPLEGEGAESAAGFSGAARAQLGLEASALDDFRLAANLFSGMLLPADASILLSDESGMKPLKALKRDALDSFFRLGHYVNGLLERNHDSMRGVAKWKLEKELLTAEAKKLKEEAAVLGDRLDQAAAENARLFEAGEASSNLIRSFEAEKLAREARMEKLEADRSGLTAQVRELKISLADRDLKIAEQDALKVELEEKNKDAIVREGEIGARIQAAIAQAKEDFKSSEEYKDELTKFAYPFYEKGADMVREEISSRYPDFDWSFLDDGGNAGGG